MNFKNFFGATALLAMMVLPSCSQYEMPVSEQNAPNGALITATVGVSAQGSIATRGVPDVFGNSDEIFTWTGESGLPSVSNIDLGLHNLTFTVGVYTQKSDGSYTLVEELQSKQGKADISAYFNFRLIKGQTYRLVAYADFSDTAKSDLTDIDLTAGRSNPNETKEAYVLNDELNDAFFVSEDFVASEHVAAILKRPFGKMRLVARDFNVFAAGETLEIENVEVTFKEQEMLLTNRFNALTGEFNGTDNATSTFAAKPAVYMQEYDENGRAAYAAVFTMYLPANFGVADESGKYAPVETGVPVPQSWMYPFDIAVTYKNKAAADKKETFTRSFDIDIPVKRNWLTTLDAESFWTDNSNIKISVDSRFDGYINTREDEVLVKTEAELNAAIKKIYDHAPHTGKIVIDADIDLTGECVYVLGRERNMTVTVDLNGHTIRQTNPDGLGVFDVRSQSDAYQTTLILEDSSKEATGTLTCDATCSEAQTLWACFGGQIIINGGNYFNNADNAVVYLYDHAQYPNWKSKITINGGYFKNYDAMTPTGISYGGRYFYYYAVLNIHNPIPNEQRVEINGGSFLDYNPLWGDNVEGVKNGNWVSPGCQVLESIVTDSESYTVKNNKSNVIWPLERTPYTGTHTLYTVIAPENPSYY